MARKRNKRRGRVNNYNANRRLPLSHINTTVHRSYLQTYEDRREWHPDRYTRPAASFNTPRHRVRAINQMTRRRKAYKPNFISPALGFQNPDKVLICVRRKQRKEVLHALNKTGKGAGKQKRPTYNEYSKISCRRT